MEAVMIKPRLMDQVRNVLRVHHYSLRTEEVYVHWIKRYILFHGKRHPRELDENHIASFLTHLATHKHVSASTQNQALSAILFLYQKVLMIEPAWVENVVRAKRPQRLPVVLTRESVAALIGEMRGAHKLLARLLYYGPLREGQQGQVNRTARKPDPRVACAARLFQKAVRT
jgi:site-specific recombinase XerD